MRCARVEQIENSICGGGCLEGIKSKCFDMFTGAVDMKTLQVRKFDRK